MTTHRPEFSLAAIGYDAHEPPLNWTEIVQPPKPDLSIELMLMINNYEQTNIQIEIDNTIFNCHMIVLQCYSKFFHNRNHERYIILPLEMVTPKAFLLIYDWMRSPNATVHRQSILEVLQATLFLNIPTLASQCWACLNDSERICEADAVLLFFEARKLQLVAVEQMMLKRVGKMFLTLVASQEYLQLRIDEVATLLRSNVIGVNVEIEVFMSAVRWLDHDWLNRKQFLMDIMKCVRFELMNMWQLVVLKRPSDSLEMQKFTDHPEIQALIEEALSIVKAKNLHASNVTRISNRAECMNLPEPRKWMIDKYWREHFDGSFKSSYHSFLDYLERICNFGPDYWKSLEFVSVNSSDNTYTQRNCENTNAIKTPIDQSSDSDSVPEIQLQSDLSAVKSDAINGSCDENCDSDSDNDISQHMSWKKSTTDSVSPYRIRFPRLLPTVPLNKLTGHHKSTENSECILAFGGSSFSQPHPGGCQVYRYLPSSNSWDLVCMMPVGRQYHSVVFFQQRIYVFGGLDPARTKTRPAREMFSFDPQLRSWYSEPSLPDGRRLHFGLITAHMQIFAVGGESGSHRIPQAKAFCYDPVATSWKRVANMCVPRSGAAFMHYKNSIWAAGGRCSGQVLTKTVERYDLLTNQWSIITELRVARCFARMCSIGDRVFIVGGEDDQRQLLPSVDVYCAKSATWKHLDNLSCCRRGFDVVTLKTRFIIIGGICECNDHHAEVECFCAQKNVWISGLRAMPSDLCGLACVSLSQRAFQR